jgi:hypothetical protein
MKGLAGQRGRGNMGDIGDFFTFFRVTAQRFQYTYRKEIPLEQLVNTLCDLK